MKVRIYQVGKKLRVITPSEVIAGEGEINKAQIFNEV